ncbi:hypothetical protein HHK36_032209 [Tetracentron sinense]|uniref:Defective in cullin neddylation protein n=1 Tax=Tetracentron sinense TaxID=13715 RepID=A0A834YAN9_TETSI|nr:hypothetical protein HHK36_032209 [Tetracentron sinense]
MQVRHGFPHRTATGCGGLCSWFTGSPEGVKALCSDVKVDHTDVRILMLAWKMGAGRQGYFTLDEWRRGLIALQADTITKLQKRFQVIENVVC